MMVTDAGTDPADEGDQVMAYRAHVIVRTPSGARVTPEAVKKHAHVGMAVAGTRYGVRGFWVEADRKDVRQCLHLAVSER